MSFSLNLWAVHQSNQNTCCATLNHVICTMGRFWCLPHAWTGVPFATHTHQNVYMNNLTGSPWEKAALYFWTYLQRLESPLFTYYKLFSQHTMTSSGPLPPLFDLNLESCLNLPFLSSLFNNKKKKNLQALCLSLDALPSFNHTGCPDSTC